MIFEDRKREVLQAPIIRGGAVSWISRYIKDQLDSFSAIHTLAKRNMKINILLKNLRFL